MDSTRAETDLGYPRSLFAKLFLAFSWVATLAVSVLGNRRRARAATP